MITVSRKRAAGLVGLMLLSLYAGTSAVRAEEGVINLCAKLSQEDTYKKEKDFKWIVAGKDGWIFRSEYDLKQEEFELSEWSSYAFKRLHDVLEKRGSKLAVAMIPTRGLVGKPFLLPPHDTKYDHEKAKAGYARLLEMIGETGIIVADTKDVADVEGFFLKRDNHWTALGARYMAQKMAEAIKASPAYADLKKVEFTTEEKSADPPQEANDNFLEFVEEQCGQPPASEKINKLYTTSRKTAGEDASQALLGEQVEKPQVVLLGTSNSTEPEPSYANFSGFLKESLGADVKNDSIPGGSMRGAIGNYVLNGDFEKDLPKVIVWELSAHYGLDQEEMFREVIPAFYGACSEKDAVVSVSGNLDASKEGTAIFKDLAAKSIFSRDYFVYLELGNKDIRELSLNFKHEEGKKDKIELERSVRNFPTNQGRFFASLHYRIDQPLKEVVLKTGGMTGSYTARICKMEMGEAAQTPEQPAQAGQ